MQLCDTHSLSGLPLMLAFLLVMIGFLSLVNAFRARGFPKCLTAAISSGTSTSLRAERFNNLVDLKSEKVVSSLEVKAGEKCVICRCWKSKKFPLCDGAHVSHNKETGDNLGPAIILGVSSTAP